MGKHKTLFVWVLLVLLGLVLVGELIFVNLELVLMSVAANSLKLIIFVLGTIIQLALGIILFLKLYNTRPDVIRWLHIYSGFSAVMLALFYPYVYDYLEYMVEITQMAMMAAALVFLVVYVCVWIGIAMYLGRAKRAKLMDFS